MTDNFRVCKDCGERYVLPIPYAEANPQIRDRCVDCIATYQLENEEPLNTEHSRNYDACHCQ
jgi:hypothetical protein